MPPTTWTGVQDSSNAMKDHEEGIGNVKNPASGQLLPIELRNMHRSYTTATANAQCSTILLQAECSEASLPVEESLMSIGKALCQLVAKLLQPPKELGRTFDCITTPAKIIAVRDSFSIPMTAIYNSLASRMKNRMNARISRTQA